MTEHIHPLESLKVWDRARLLQQLKGHEDRLRQLIGLFLDGLPDRIRKLEAGMQAADLEVVQFAAHALKGSAGSLYAMRLFQLSEDMDKAAKAQDLLTVRELWPLLFHNYEELDAMLRLELAASL